MNKVKEGFGKLVQKIALKKSEDFNYQLEEFEDLFKQGSQVGMDFMNQMFSDIEFDNINNLGRDGAILKKSLQKKICLKSIFN